MRMRLKRNQPHAWSERKMSIASKWTTPFWAVEWCCEWLAYFLNNWAFLEVLEYASTFGVLIAVISYFAESGDRLKQKHYQAWQVINSAQGKGGAGGRIEALQELNADRVPLVGVDLSGAFLQGVRLPRASLVRSNFTGSDVRDGDFEAADLADSELKSSNFRMADLRHSSLRGADWGDADLSGADLTEADLSGANFVNADLSGADLSRAKWKGVGSLQKANIQGIRNAPEGFVAWALSHGATQIGSPADTDSTRK